MQGSSTETFRREHFLGILLRIEMIYDQNKLLLHHQKGQATHFVSEHKASLTFTADSLSPD